MSSQPVQHGRAVERPGAGGAAAPWIEPLARLGYGAKGVVYLLVGGLAVAAALGRGGQTEGSGGAIQHLAAAPYGQVLLFTLAVGLLGFVVWRATQALVNPENESGRRRAFFVVSGLVYAALAVEAARSALGPGGSGSGEAEADHWAATLMAQPLGQGLVVVVGAALALYGLQQIGKAFTADLDRRLALGSLSGTSRTWVRRFGRTGLAARGIVFSMMGGFLAAAGVTSDPSEARGVGGALRSLREQPYGPWLLGAVALGLMAYGLYCLVRARWRRITPA
ncbi:MAG TPA: DUF1206 domain-containing protein [Longimicrobiales bacterium]|nr:DUF1206 domain-containing protein [Longimicrobiales bacterium]